MDIKPCLVLAVLGAACGGSDVSIDTSADNVCSQIADVACHNLYQCCSEGEIEDFLNVTDPRTEVQCRDDVARLCDRAIAQRDFSISQNRSAFDPTIMNTCLQALIAPDGLCASIADVLPWTEACMNDAWVGKVADGGECLQPFECASADSFCAANQKCTALPTQGQTCSNQCASGLFCNGTCQPQLGQGQTCNSSNSCQKTLFCDFSQSPSKCTALGGGGDPCTSNQSCESNQCIPGQCAGNNNSCFTDNNCNGHCADDNSFCSQDSNCGTGHCSTTTTTSCTINTQCPQTPTVETCVFPIACLPGDCVGQPVCTATQVTIDYCTGALAELPFP